MNKPTFRAWDKNAKVMRSWEDLILTKDKGDSFWLIGYEENEVVTSLDHEQILMQYTGLRNLKGIEICESDRLHYSNCDGEIDVITKRNGCFWSGDTPLYQCAFEEAKIIGNIYEM